MNGVTTLPGLAFAPVFALGFASVFALAPDSARVVSAPSPAPHTELVATYPAADSLHTSPVSEIRLRFSTAVQLSLSTVTVLGPEGVLRPTDTLRLAGSGGQELQQPLGGPLATGDYRVEWRTAGPDGHPLRGDYTFAVRYQVPPTRSDTVGAPVPDIGDAQLTEVAADEGSGGGATDGRLLGAAARWLLYLTMTAALGGFVFRSFVLTRVADAEGGEAWGDAVASRMTGIAWMGVAAGLVALPLLLGVQAVQTFGGEGLGPSALARVLASAWGGAFMAQVAGVALLALGLLVARARGPRWGWLLAGTAGILIAAGAARGGHAAGGGALVQTVHALHACAAAVWMGGLLLLVLAVLPASRSDPARLPHAVDAFSRVALIAVGVLVVTGVFNNWDRLGGLGALITTSFGRTLSLKLALFGLAAALGFYNWRTVRPMLRADPRPGLLRVPASLELGLGLAVLAVTALLVALPLP